MEYYIDSSDNDDELIVVGSAGAGWAGGSELAAHGHCRQAAGCGRAQHTTHDCLHLPACQPGTHIVGVK